ncbi:hypothetical protein B0T21DRAFT_409829 [Apiosordaria backusii]|uniref:Uncharacterized protein n=1 Tax=Apiosordaria backusii TaxID=314023 RepID=A0AA40BSD4_9PEZI|nr:hypothetical protein B0T21DRAFT_409829 [Apiosordaria backusii]
MLSILAFLAGALALSSVAYSAPDSIHNNSSLAPIEPKDKTGWKCDIQYASPADIQQIWNGAGYLYQLDGKARIGPGDHCDRVSCSWNAGIFLCNKNNFVKEVEWKQIGDAAQFLIEHCGKDGQVMGQVDFKGNWNVVVREDPC